MERRKEEKDLYWKTWCKFCNESSQKVRKIMVSSFG